MRIAVVILNWNTEGFLRKFLPGLVRSVETVHGAEVVVADNASTDGSVQVVRELFPDVEILVFERNLGFTGGYNEAFRLLEQSHPEMEYFLLINSDIEVGQAWLEPLVEWMDGHPDCGACAPKLHSYQQRDMFEYAGAAGGFIDKYGYPFCRGRVLKTLERDMGQYDSPAEVFWATGACLMVRSELWKRLGGLDSRFFAHMEEIDLCWRMKLEGYSVNVVPSSMVWHVGGGTLPASSPMKLFLNYRNNLLMLSNNLSKHYAVEEYREGRGAVQAAQRGIRRARRRIFERMVLDGMSAIVYLLTFKWSYFKAVIRAHNEYRRLKSQADATQVADYLLENGEKANLSGIYPHWIIPRAILHPSDVKRASPDPQINIRTKPTYKQQPHNTLSDYPSDVKRAAPTPQITQGQKTT